MKAFWGGRHHQGHVTQDVGGVGNFADVGIVEFDKGKGRGGDMGVDLRPPAQHRRRRIRIRKADRQLIQPCIIRRTELLIPATAILSPGPKSARDLIFGLVVFKYIGVELMPLSPAISAVGLPSAFDHRIRKPGVPTAAMSKAPASKASLMTLPPSRTRHTTLVSPNPSFLICFSIS